MLKIDKKFLVANRNCDQSQWKIRNNCISIMCRLDFLFLEVFFHDFNTIFLSVINTENLKTLTYHIYYLW